MSNKRTHISSSELQVLLYLYRTVIYGLELRNRKKISVSCTPDLKQPSPSTPTCPTKRKPLGPRSSPSTSQTSRPASVVPPSEDESHFETVLAAASAKAMAISRHVQGGFADFPLIEDDLDSDKDSQPREYATPRTPFHSPSQSPRFSPPPFLPSLEAVSSHFTWSTAKPKKEKTKADISAELHFQDALGASSEGVPSSSGPL